MKTSHLVSASAVAGLAMGASIALAAHPPIQLYTYEEVAAQYLGGTYGPMNPAGTINAPGKLPVMIANSKYPASPGYMQGMPYSPKQTCFGDQVQNGLTVACHGNTGSSNTKIQKTYNDLSQHAFHSMMGRNEMMDNSVSGLFMENGKQTGLNPQKPWVQNHGMDGKW